MMCKLQKYLQLNNLSLWHMCILIIPKLYSYCWDIICVSVNVKNNTGGLWELKDTFSQIGSIISKDHKLHYLKMIQYSEYLFS